MKNNISVNKSLDEMTITESLQHDVAEIVFRSNVIIDPAPFPMIPLAPIVIGKKVIKGAEKALKVIKRSFLN